MRAFYAGVIVLAAVSMAQAKKPRGKLACEVTEEDGKTFKVPSPKLRLQDSQVVCRLSVADDDAAAAARVQTWWSDRDDKGARVKREGHDLTGRVAGQQPFQAVLVPDRDFKTCVEFTIDARILDDKGRASWRKSVRVKQYCPDGPGLPGKD
jgi:hypothetical protein